MPIQTDGEALEAIWKIIHTPTSATAHRKANDHFQADFDAIRKIIREQERATGV